MEDLIAEAVEDHYRQNSSGEKTPSSQSPTQELAQGSVPVLPQQPKTDWIWEWSSGVERQPPNDLLNVNFYIVVPTIVITHLVAFGIGMYVGKKMAVIQSS
ncbi:hypothetical protein QZH41_000713 [Actinostola sp. cb2023]|nr:hypothetical protein QZH41_005388 [Actinostola sp. cb2023]KAK3739804.1 hypothetical protein QZH41_000713 [Actinostola sp. cb2023]